jgi:succinate-acetate transporter protein
MHSWSHEEMFAPCNTNQSILRAGGLHDVCSGIIAVYMSRGKLFLEQKSVS